jgi:hypothetical protein
MAKAIEIQSPNEFKKKAGYTSVFLAGSIEMGEAEDWQKEIIDSLKNEDIIFLNPRRDDWDSSWEQVKTDKNFKEQVTWELTALEFADYIALYIDPKTQARITLLELGLHAKSKKLIVCCPEGFDRKGNVDITCDLYDIEQVDTLEELIEQIRKKVN